MNPKISAMMLQLHTKSIRAAALRKEAGEKLHEALEESPDCEEFLGIYQEKLRTYDTTLAFLGGLSQNLDLTPNLFQIAQRLENELEAYTVFLSYLIEILTDPKEL